MDTANARNLLNLPGKKISLILILCVSMMPLFGQIGGKGNYNFYDFQQKHYYFGITLGLNSSSFIPFRSKDYIYSDSINVVESLSGPGFNLGIVEQHVLAGAEGYRGHGCCDIAQALRSAHHVAGRHVGEFAGIAIEVETVHALGVFTVVVSALAAGTADAAGRRTVDRHQIAGLYPGNTGPDGGDFG